MSLSFWKIAPFAVLAAACAPVYGQLRVVQYNTANQNDADGYFTTVFSGIASQSVNGIARPIDIITLEECTTTTVGSASSTSSLIAALNRAAGTTDDYAVSAFTAISSGDQQVVVYRKSTVQLVASTTFSTAGPRDIVRAQLRPVGYGSSADLYVYAAHLKASTGSDNVTERASEMATMRLNADTLGANKNVIYGGDFNFYTSSEAGYKNLIGTSTATGVTAANNNAAVDPVSGSFVSGDWTSNSAKILHTQSPVVTSGQNFGGQVGGGMDDRFDFSLPSRAASDSEGLALIAGSYRAYGNNGTHTVNGNISTGTGASAAVLSALEHASDHIPVVSDYQVPARMTATIASVPGNLILRGATANVDVAVTNSANVSVAIGADELDYAITATGTASGATTGTVNALAGAQHKTLTLNTATAGAKTASATVTATSEQVPDGPVSASLNYSVVDPSNGSFSGSADTNTKAIDLGVVRIGQSASQSFTVFNLPTTAGYTAGLALNSVLLTNGSGHTISGSSFLNLVADASSGASFTASSIASSTLGTSTSTYTFSVGDTASVFGATSTQTPLTLTVTSKVVTYANAAAGTTAGIPAITATYRIDARPELVLPSPLTTGSVSIAAASLSPDALPTLLIDFSSAQLSPVLSDWTADGVLNGYTVSSFDADTLVVTFSDAALQTSGLTFSWNLTGTNAAIAAITVVPEPGMAGAVVGVFGILLGSRRRR